MIKPPKLHQHDQVAIVSLSAGTLGGSLCRASTGTGNQTPRSNGIGSALYAQCFTRSSVSKSPPRSTGR